ncbi:MAG TPA: ankyrin repeat domain-containing protein [Verrucomicrobiae bacterium]|nr:ankyrin repeat domain-containing protein [Verrucomicrobiae bacterium]
MKKQFLINMGTLLKPLIIAALASNVWAAEAQDYKSDAEYEKLRSYASPSSFYPDGNSGQLQLLVMCVDRGDSVLLDKLLIAAPDFANVNEGMSDSSPIHWAAFKGDTNILNVLLRHHSDIKKKGTNWEISALHLARDSYTAEFLLDHGAELESLDIHGQTPLMWAAKRGNAEVAETLIKRGARLDSHDKADWTALEFAQTFGHSNVVALLSAKGAAPSRKNKSDYPFEAVVGSWLQYGTNHPFAQTTLVYGSPAATNQTQVGARVR